MSRTVAEHTRTAELLDRLRQQPSDLLRVQDQLRTTIRDSQRDLDSLARSSNVSR